MLDEATAFADPENEYMVQKAFERLAKDKTVIMIAHRLTTVKNADCIYVMKDGALRKVVRMKSFWRTTAFIKRCGTIIRLP